MRGKMGKRIQSLISTLLSKKKMAGDFGWNLGASLASTLAMQVILLPFLGRRYDSNTYGYILTFYSIANTIVLTCGNTLNNVRLIRNSTYKSENVTGDYPVLLIVLATIGVIATYIATRINSATAFAGVLLGIYCLFAVLRTYGEVANRLVIDYRKNFIVYVGLGIGNLIGILPLLFIKNTDLWVIPFITGEIVSVLILLFSTKIYYEPIKKTHLFWGTVGREGILLSTTLITNVVNYLDRLLLLPILGGTAVSAYTVATFFGKSVAILMNPISSVLLSYYSSENYVMTRKRFWRINGLVIVMSGVFYLASILLGRWVSGLFYPTIIEEAKPYLLIGNAAAIINVTANMVHPSVLKYASLKWQIVLKLVHGFIYIIGGSFAAKTGGLRYFCYAALLAACVNLVLQFIIGDLALKEPRSDD